MASPRFPGRLYGVTAISPSDVWAVGLTNGGTAISSLSGAGVVTLGANTLTLSNASGAFSGAIGGSGGLTLMAGAENLTGASTYHGVTTLDGARVAAS